MAQEIQTRSRMYLITPLDGQPQQLYLQIEVDCPACGGYEVQVHGPHLRVLQQIVNEAVREFPGMCGEAAPIAERTTVEGVVDPRTVRNN